MAIVGGKITIIALNKGPAIPTGDSLIQLNL
jgi:hypothetical protein